MNRTRGSYVARCVTQGALVDVNAVLADSLEALVAVAPAAVKMGMRSAAPRVRVRQNARFPRRGHVEVLREMRGTHDVFERMLAVERPERHESFLRPVEPAEPPQEVWGLGCGV